MTFRSVLKELIQQHRITQVEINEDRAIRLETYTFQIAGEGISVQAQGV